MSAWDPRDTDDSRRPEGLGWCGRSQHQVPLPGVCALGPTMQKEYTSGVLSAVALGPTMARAPQGPACTMTQEAGEGKTWGEGQWIRAEYLSSRGQPTGNRGGPAA